MDELKKKERDAVKEAIREKGARWTAGDNPVTDLCEDQKRNLLGVVRSQNLKKERLDGKN